jgi:hypothetical protein
MEKLILEVAYMLVNLNEQNKALQEIKAKREATIEELSHKLESLM